MEEAKLLQIGSIIISKKIIRCDIAYKLHSLFFFTNSNIDFKIANEQILYRNTTQAGNRNQRFGD